MGWRVTPLCSSLATSFQKLGNSKKEFQERQEKSYWRNGKLPSWKERRRSRTSWGAIKEYIKWPRSPLGGKVWHLWSLLTKKPSGCPQNEKLKFNTLQLVTSNYMQVKVPAECRRTSLLTLDKLIYKLLKGSKILMPQTATSLCVQMRKIPQGHARSHAFFSSFALSLKFWLAVVAKIKLSNEMNGRSDPGWQFLPPQLLQQHVKARDVYVY